MTEEVIKSRTLFEQLNVGVQKYLELKTGVCKVEMESLCPADRSVLLSWEQKNMVFLPEDLKNFYLTSDGFLFTWSVKIENGPIPVGRMYINSINKLQRIGGTNNNTQANPSLADIDDSDIEDEGTAKEKPSFDSRCKVFELDPCDGYGKVCLVYREAKAGEPDQKVDIWFLDRALRWHFITDSFTSYYRLMIMHLGLPQWQYAFTDIGLCQQAKQWFNMYAPLRLELDAELNVTGSFPLESSGSVTQIDVGKVFKGKSDKKKPVPTQTQSQLSQIRKKPTGSAKPGLQSGLKSSGSASQLINKK